LKEIEKSSRARVQEPEYALASSNAKIERLEQSLVEEQIKVEAASERATTAERASAVLELHLDELPLAHSKQLQQRPARESVLESTVQNSPIKSLMRNDTASLWSVPFQSGLLR
jgi:hypothetical protein